MSRGLKTLAVALVLAPSAYASSTPAVAGSRHCRAGCATARPPCHPGCVTAGRSCRVAPRVGTPALSDAAAARLVHRSRWEPRPDNGAANRRVPSGAELAYFHAHSEMPYKDQVTGAFGGSTDEIIQWAAYKHGLDPDLLRAVAAVESWWRMSTIGNGGESFGLFQLRSPYNCCASLAANDTAFNADYYGAIIRSYYDGRQGWLNTVAGNGVRYGAGDLWGSVGAWFSGRWHDPGAERYVGKVKRYLCERVWRRRGF